MLEETVSIPSGGLRPHGVVSVPDDVALRERRPAFLVLHGFGGNCKSQNVVQPCRALGEFGYVRLRFDMRGCGESKGEFGLIGNRRLDLAA